jgi:hypothetical protein
MHTEFANATAGRNQISDERTSCSSFTVAWLPKPVWAFTADQVHELCFLTLNLLSSKSLGPPPKYIIITRARVYFDNHEAARGHICFLIQHSNYVSFSREQTLTLTLEKTKHVCQKITFSLPTFSANTSNHKHALKRDDWQILTADITMQNNKITAVTGPSSREFCQSVAHS